MSHQNSQSPLNDASALATPAEAPEPPQTPTTESHAIIDHQCMLVSDSTGDCVPSHLQQLLAHYEQPTQSELFFALVYAIGLEAGFVPKAEQQRCDTLGRPLQRLPAASTFHIGNLLQLCQMRPSIRTDLDKTIFECRMLNYVDTAAASLSRYDTQLETLLTGLVTGEDMIVSLSPGKFDDAQWPHLSGRSVCLPLSRYVLHMRLANGKPVQRLFRQLAEMSLRLRNEFYIPMRNQQLKLFDEIYMYPSLEGLPSELYDNIFQHLSEKELKKVANVSRTMNDCAKRSKYFRI